MATGVVDDVWGVLPVGRQPGRSSGMTMGLLDEARQRIRCGDPRRGRADGQGRVDQRQADHRSQGIESPAAGAPPARRGAEDRDEADKRCRGRAGHAEPADDEDRCHGGDAAEHDPAQSGRKPPGHGNRPTVDQASGRRGDDEGGGRVGGKDVVGQLRRRQREGADPHQQPEKGQAEAAPLERRSVGAGRPPRCHDDGEGEEARPGVEADEHRQKVKEDAAAVILHWGCEAADVVNQEKPCRPLPVGPEADSDIPRGGDSKHREGEDHRTDERHGPEASPDRSQHLPADRRRRITAGLPFDGRHPREDHCQRADEADWSLAEDREAAEGSDQSRLASGEPLR